jgi:hypothetical protein
MDAARKKQLKTQWRDEQRTTAFAALPLPVRELKAMFDMLDVELPRKGCDHSRRLTRAWLHLHGHDVERVFAWLDTQSGFCDCEVLANVEQQVHDAAGVFSPVGSVFER